MLVLSIRAILPVISKEFSAYLPRGCWLAEGQRLWSNANSQLLTTAGIRESPARSRTVPHAGCSRPEDLSALLRFRRGPLPHPSPRPGGSNRALDFRGRTDRVQRDRDWRQHWPAPVLRWHTYG